MTQADCRSVIGLIGFRWRVCYRGSEALGVNYPTASHYIKRLEAAVLREITGGSRNRVYRADEVLAAIEEPLA